MIDIHGGPAASRAGKRLVDDVAGKPSAQSGLPAEEVEIGEGAEVGFLQRVFSLGHHLARCCVQCD